jgi:hypothetical protein
MCNVLHYRLLSRSPTASIPIKHLSPVTLREKDGMAHKCEYCGCETVRKINILVQQLDVDEENNNNCYVSFCSKKCERAHMTECKKLIPGLELREKDPVDPFFVVRMGWANICVPGEGEAFHNMWRLQYVLQKVKDVLGIIAIPCDFDGHSELVKWDGQLCAPAIHMSLDELNEKFPKVPSTPVPA